MEELLKNIGDVVHHLQRERGCSVLFLGSSKAIFRSQLEEQHLATCHALRKLTYNIKQFMQNGKCGDIQFERLYELTEKYSALPDKRIKILEKTTPQHEAINLYTHELISPLLHAMTEMAAKIQGVSPSRALAFSAFLNWKEKIGLERTLGIQGVTHSRFNNDDFKERILFLLAEQKNYLDIFFSLADNAYQKILKKIFDMEIFKHIEKIHEHLKSHKNFVCFSEFAPEMWFNLITNKIDILQKYEKKLAENLVMHAPTPEKNKLEGARQNSNAGDPHILIKSLKLFSGLSDDHVGQLARVGQIRNFPKGKILFLEGEHPDRLYVILKGWVKIFKGTIAGEETILQMLSSKDTILESAALLDTPYTVSAQTVEATTLLSFPSSILREQLSKNNMLAVNLLTSVSQRTQNLIRQIENTRLKSADERVGWFLLKLLQEQGRRSVAIRLPYDKSMAASYLDMKRETFSRALKRLKLKGFRIENDQIIIPSLSSLCGHCDPEIAARCPFHATKSCPNPQSLLMNSQMKPQGKFANV